MTSHCNLRKHETSGSHDGPSSTTATLCCRPVRARKPFVLSHYSSHSRRRTAGRCVRSSRTFPAPRCRWRHSDSCQFKTLLIAAPPRIKYPTHGVKNAALPWAEKSSRFTTIMFERFAIDLLMAAQTVKGAKGILRASWDETWHILKKAVARGQARKTDKVMPRPGIDEKAFRKG
jgi:transposase